MRRPLGWAAVRIWGRGGLPPCGEKVSEVDKREGHAREDGGLGRRETQLVFGERVP